MEDISTNVKKVHGLQKELRKFEERDIDSAQFTKSAKKLLESYYCIRTGPNSWIYRENVANNILSASNFPSFLGLTLTRLMQAIAKISPYIDESATNSDSYKSAAFIQSAILNYTDVSSKLSYALLLDTNYIYFNKAVLDALASKHNDLTPNNVSESIYYSFVV